MNNKNRLAWAGYMLITDTYNNLIYSLYIHRHTYTDMTPTKKVWHTVYIISMYTHTHIHTH